MSKQVFVADTILTASAMNTLQGNDYNQTVNTSTASYVLVASDVGTRRVMNAAGSTTITVNTSLFSAGDTLFIQNIGAGTCTITAGTATVSSTSSLALAQYGGGTLYFTSAGVSIFFLAGSASVYGRATGGIGAPTSVTISSVDYQYLTFNSTGTLTVTSSGFFDYLAIGGGNGSMKEAAATYAGGGGGAGQVVIGSIYLDTDQTITIGAGSSFAASATSSFNQAGNTSIAATSPFTQTALGGLWSMSAANASTGYVGGGVGSYNNATSVAITESTVLGYRGGNSTNATTNAGGGGGQSGRGGNGATTTGGTGGAGFDIAAFVGGSATFKAQGGGGGGSVTGGSASTGGVAGSANTTPPNGGANTGQGGGGGFGNCTTGNGGSGCCFIRWEV